MKDAPNQKGLKTILLEGFTDIIGFDKGYLRTSIDIVRRPADVIAAYHQNQNLYTRPMAFMLLSAGLYITVANYLVDWEYLMKALITFMVKILPDKDASPSPEKLALAYDKSAAFMEDFFSKYIVMFFFAISFLRAAYFVRITPEATYPQMLVIMLYRNGGNLLVSTLFLFPLLLKNEYMMLIYLFGIIVLDQYIFKGYINAILGPGTRKIFTKRLWIMLVVTFTLAMLIQLFLEWLGFIN